MSDNSIKKINVVNIIRFAVSLLIYVVVVCIIWKQLSDGYKGVCEEQILKEYMGGICIAGGAALALLLVYWCMLTICKGELRSICEEYSGVYSIIVFIVLVVVCLVLFQRKYQGVIDTNGDLHKLPYIFVFPALYGMNICLLSPLNIKDVLLPGKSAKIRWVIGGAILLAILICFYKQK